MYFFPGYVYFEKENDGIHVYSDLFQSEIVIDEDKLIDEFFSLVERGGCESLHTELEIFLYEQGMIQKKSEIVKSLDEVKGLLAQNLFLTLMPTEKCNFRCTYCYESYNNGEMSEVLIKHIYSYISSQAPYIRGLNIGWFGGEPTLCEDYIFEMSNFIKDLQKKYNFEYTANMTTNGYLLNLDKFKKYYDLGINNYQVTMDGWDHDKTRPHVSGRGTLDVILDNLKNISSLPEKYEFEITIRNNILDSDIDFTWYDYLKKHFGEDPRFFVHVVPVKNWGGSSVKKLKLLEDERKYNARKKCEDYLDKIGMLRFGVKKYPFSDICYASCPKGFIFRSNGKIEKCSIVLDHPKNLVGEVHPEKGVQLYLDACEQWTSGTVKEECLTCRDVLSCLNISCKKGIVIDNCSEDTRICEMFKNKKGNC